MKLHDALQQQIAATHDGVPWYGTGRSALLAGLRATDAAAHPVPGAHSIWELVLHMTAWTQEVEQRLAGHAPGEPDVGDWPRVGRVTEARWQVACADLAAANASLLRAMAALPVARWAEHVGDNRDPAINAGVTISAMLVGLAQHDAYHTGQIALLRRALG